MRLTISALFAALTALSACAPAEPDLTTAPAPAPDVIGADSASEVPTNAPIDGVASQ